MKRPHILSFLFLAIALNACLSPVEQAKEENEEIAEKQEVIQSKTSFEAFNLYDNSIQEVAARQNIDWMLIKAIMIKESHANEKLVSTTGAVGLMQLMPRQGSFINSSYKNYQLCRKQRFQKDGLRYFKGKSEKYWAESYRSALDSLKQSLSASELKSVDLRFDPDWNLHSGCQQFSSDFRFFRQRGHGPYTSRMLAIAAYNAGRYAVMTDRKNPKTDRIPINRQTEFYVAHVERIFQELKPQNGKIMPENLWTLHL